MAFKIFGKEKLKKKFAVYPDFVLKGIRKAMENAAQDIVNMAQTLVAKGDTGELEESIGWTWGKAPRGALTLASVGGKETAGDLVITVYAGNSEAFYARWVEFGTAKHNVSKGGGTKAGKRQAARGGGIGHPGTPAQPFFYVSYRALRKKSAGSIKSSVARAGKKAAAL